LIRGTLTQEATTTQSLILPLLQDRPPGAVHHRSPESDPGQWEDDHAGPSAYPVEHELAGDQGQEKDQDPTPEWNLVEFARLFFWILSAWRGLLALIRWSLLFCF